MPQPNTVQSAQSEFAGLNIGSPDPRSSMVHSPYNRTAAQIRPTVAFANSSPPLRPPPPSMPTFASQGQRRENTNATLQGPSSASAITQGTQRPISARPAAAGEPAATLTDPWLAQQGIRAHKVLGQNYREMSAISSSKFQRQEKSFFEPGKVGACPSPLIRSGGLTLRRCS